MITETNKPSHYVFAVRKIGRDKSVWSRIGAAWHNRDGDGFSLRLDLMPVGDADIVIRKPKPEEAEPAAS